MRPVKLNVAVIYMWQYNFGGRVLPVHSLKGLLVSVSQHIPGWSYVIMIIIILGHV